jgi:hypothetical protein
MHACVAACLARSLAVLAMTAGRRCRSGLLPPPLRSACAAPEFVSRPRGVRLEKNTGRLQKARAPPRPAARCSPHARTTHRPASLLRLAC